MFRKSKVVYAVCAAFFGFRVLLIILDCLDLKGLIPLSTSLEDNIWQVLSFGKVQYDIAMLVVSLFCPYVLFRYCMRNGTEKSNSHKPLSRKGNFGYVALTILTHVLFFGIFQSCILTLYTSNPSAFLDILNWLWKPMLVLLLDYLVARCLLQLKREKTSQWCLADVLSAFFLCTFVMDLLTSGFMWRSNCQALYLMSFLFELLFVAERMAAWSSISKNGSGYR